MDYYTKYDIPDPVDIFDIEWTSQVVIVTTSLPHNFVQDEHVRIFDVLPSGYNGTYIIDYISTTEFSFKLVNDPGIYTSGGKTQIFPYPVTLNDVKNYLKVTNTVEDDLLINLIIAANTDLENYTNRTFYKRNFLCELDFLYCSRFDLHPYIELKQSPFNLLVSIEYIYNSTWTDLTDYIFENNIDYARIRFKDSLPTVDTDVARPMRVDFWAGYGLYKDIPFDIKEAIKLWVNFRYRNRGDCIGTGNNCGGAVGGLDSIRKTLASYRILRTFGWW